VAERKSVADIVDYARDSQLGSIVKGTLIGGPIATLGYGLSYGVDSVVGLYTGVIATLGDVTSGNLQAIFGSFPLILNAGAEGSAGALASWGILAWLVAVAIILASIIMIARAYDRLDIETLSGIGIPGVDRFTGASPDEEEE
jgi:hypothetical protein